MTRPLARLAGFAILLIAVFAGAALLGGAADPSRPSAGESADRHGSPDAGAMSSSAADDRHGAGHEPPAADAAPPGLQVAQDGYRLVLDRDRYPARHRVPLQFRIVDARGEPVTSFELAHEKRLHMIVVRRDLSGFQHLHPAMRANGTWTARVDLSRPGTWRVFADFTRDGVQRTLGADVQVPGAFAPATADAAGPTSSPATADAPTRTSSRASADGATVGDRPLDVTIRAAAPRAGEERRIAFEVRDGGRVVNDELQPYLGAKGHLVALRAGDLAYLHTHPDGDRLAFAASWPSAGTYRLYVQFRYQGRVHTASFSQEVPR